MTSMKRFSYGIAAAILTFVVGIGVVSALVLKSAPEPPPPQPPAVGEKTLEMVGIRARLAAEVRALTAGMKPLRVTRAALATSR